MDAYFHNEFIVGVWNDAAGLALSRSMDDFIRHRRTGELRDVLRYCNGIRSDEVQQHIKSTCLTSNARGVTVVS